MLDIDYKTFNEVCPSATQPDSALFESIYRYIDDRKRRILKFITPAVANHFDIPGDCMQPPYVSLLRDTVKYICTAAYLDALPHLDLVLTPTGFGVVNNQNVAPASVDRVNNLREQLRRAKSEAMDDIIDSLRHCEGWYDSSEGSQAVRTLFWSARHMALLGVSEPTRDDLIASMPEIMEAHTLLASTISPEQTDDLVRIEATASGTEVERRAIRYARDYMVARIKGHRSVGTARDILLTYINDNLDKFPTYRDSSTYKAQHYKPYENKKDDPCFFFG